MAATHATIAAMNGRLTELLIVPTAHLTADTPEDAVRGARERLVAWEPDLVAVEALPGHLVVEYEQRGGPFADFNVGGAPLAREAAELVESPSHDVWHGRRLAMDASAPVSDRVIGWCRAREPLNALLLPWQAADLPSRLAAFLQSLSRDPRETSRIGATIARTLGHELLAHVDDHCGVENLAHPPPDFTERRQIQVQRVQPLIDSLNLPEQIVDLWALWQQLGTPESQGISERLESSEWVIGEGMGIEAHRLTLATWRARNLAMAARLRSATAMVPGGRVVFIVGLAHLQPIRRALQHDQYDLRLVDLSEF